MKDSEPRKQGFITLLIRKLVSLLRVAFAFAFCRQELQAGETYRKTDARQRTERVAVQL